MMVNINCLIYYFKYMIVLDLYLFVAIKNIMKIFNFKIIFKEVYLLTFTYFPLILNSLLLYL